MRSMALIRRMSLFQGQPPNGDPEDPRESFEVLPLGGDLASLPEIDSRSAPSPAPSKLRAAQAFFLSPPTDTQASFRGVDECHSYLSSTLNTLSIFKSATTGGRVISTAYMPHPGLPSVVDVELCEVETDSLWRERVVEALEELKTRGISQNDVAKHCDMNQSGLSQLVHGQTSRSQYVARVSKAVGVALPSAERLRIYLRICEDEGDTDAPIAVEKMLDAALDLRAKKPKPKP